MDITTSDPSGSVFKYLFPCVCVPVMFPRLWTQKIESCGVWRSGGSSLTHWATDEGDSLMFVLSIASLVGAFCLTGFLCVRVSTGRPIATDACDSWDVAESMQWHVFVLGDCILYRFVYPAKGFVKSWWRSTPKGQHFKLLLCKQGFTYKLLSH